MNASAAREASVSVESARPLLDVEGLGVCFPSGDREVEVVKDVAFAVAPGQTLGLVGESGSGKSMTLRAILGLVPRPGRVSAGRATWRGAIDLLPLDERGKRATRGAEIAMIFQDPLESLDPLFTVGAHMAEVLTGHGRLSRGHARERAVELLARVGIPAPQERLRAYPHQLSGGMRQRVVIALAIARAPAMLLADEPTTALDVTIQAQILNLLEDLREDSGMAVIIVSHDLAVVAQSCDRIAVMYAGRIVEIGTTDEVLESPRHPYTAALLASEPGTTATRSELRTIPGQPPLMTELPAGCPFAPRCRFARDECREISIALDLGPLEHSSACPMVEAHEQSDAA
jgi:oligopeptide/dipeptide ABC transporter ATP-binding protein